MAGITLEIAEARLEKYLSAEERILLGQSVDMYGEKLTRADLAAVQEGIALWQKRCIGLSPGGGINVVEVIPR